MGEIARRAGVSKGTLYVYFASKEALFETLITDERRALAETLFQLDAADPDVRGVLRRLGITYVSTLARPSSFQRCAWSVPQCGREWLRDYLDVHVKNDRLTIEDTAVAAGHFLDLCLSGTLRRLLMGVGEPPTDREIAFRVDEALRVFFAAYGPKS